MSSISYIGNEKCTGCGGCAVVCPHDAVELKLDVDGFIVAQTNNKCVDCGKCTDVCIKFWESDATHFPKATAVYAGSNKNLEVRYPSSSGGIVTALATAALTKGYVVVGAWLDVEHGELKHIIITKESDLELIRGSKYIPSYTKDAFVEIASHEKVMYIGTPCQVYTLQKIYPQKDMIYVDFRCAGTVGYNLFEKYSTHLRKINSSGIKAINFRAKNRNWHIWGVETIFNDGDKFFLDKQHDIFGKCFSVYGDAVHNVCRECCFASESLADLRVEDAWHQMQHVKPYDYKNGFSQVAVFTEKGHDLLSDAKHMLNIKEVQNDFHLHTDAKAKCPKESSLYHMIRNDIIPIEKTIQNYERSLPFLRKVEVYLSYLASVNLYIYRIIRAIYKKITRRHR